MVPRQSCKQCGTCCRKGGPALHLPDIDLLRQGRLAREHLITFRPGEYVYDNVAGRVQTLQTDLIKIRSRPGVQQCILFDEPSAQCLAYANRPQECRMLECWSPEELMRMYGKDRLQRTDFLSEQSAMRELVELHEKRCAYILVEQLVARILNRKDRDALNELSDLVEFDQEIRRQVADKTVTPVDTLDLYFGRPLLDTLPCFGLRAEKKEGRTIFRPDRSYSDRIKSQNSSSRI